MRSSTAGAAPRWEAPGSWLRFHLQHPPSFRRLRRPATTVRTTAATSMHVLSLSVSSLWPLGHLSVLRYAGEVQYLTPGSCRQHSFVCGEGTDCIPPGSRKVVDVSSAKHQIGARFNGSIQQGAGRREYPRVLARSPCRSNDLHYGRGQIRITKLRHLAQTHRKITRSDEDAGQTV